MLDKDRSFPGNKVQQKRLTKELRLLWLVTQAEYALKEIVPSAVDGDSHGIDLRPPAEPSSLAPHMLQLLISRQLALKFLTLKIAGRTRRHILIHRRHLLIPTNAHPRPLRQRKLELHPQHPRSPRRRRAFPMLPRRLLFRHYDFEHEIVVRRQSGGGVDVADRVGVWFRRRHEFHVDLPARGVEVCFPARFDLVAGQRSGVLVQNAFPFAADFVGMLGACGTDNLAVFFDFPDDAADAPAALDIFQAVVDDSCDGHSNGEFADWVYDTGYGHSDTNVCWRKDAEGGFVAAGHEGALDGQSPGDRNGIRHAGEGFSVQHVINTAEIAVGGCGEMAWE